MKDETVGRSTGKNLSEWYSVISGAGLADATHKAIADFLAGFPELSFWWAQTITVEYEKHIGRRILGQTGGGAFQVGVSRTVGVSPSILWDYLESPAGIGLLLGAGDRPGGEPVDAELEHLDHPGDSLTPAARTTTWNPGSHFRMQFTMPGWESYSILQVRLEEKGPLKTTVTFHQEKLPDEAAREEMKVRWKSAAAAIAETLL